MHELARIYFRAQVPLNNCQTELQSFGIYTTHQEGGGKGWLVLYEMDSHDGASKKMAELAEKYRGEFWQNPLNSSSAISWREIKEKR
jgi:hypothetical protein